ncbi:hypothetical protein NW762_014433 [Fusarium torreyae]|uniref:Cas1p 10 TM acyl transferase domain-containing protein n=1 Tax=Fusarium torreyae TaxID=1237075 RepID=A0A9W8RIT8_9HYPO|nr:hypothetical protein NW762_014433 [Fusarium torreyae]
MSLPLARLFATIVATLFLAAIALRTLFPGNDPYRCRAVQNTGRWLDLSRDKDGNRDVFRQWQPDGCIFNDYKSEDIRRCMQGRRIVIAGDSTSRNVAHGMSRLLDRRRTNNDRKHGLPRAQAFNMTYHGQMVQRLPNAYIAAHGTPGQEDFVQCLEMYADEKRNPSPIEDQEGPGMIYLAAGVWFAKQKGTKYANKTTGNVPWDVRFNVYQDHFTKLSKFIADNTPTPYDPFTAPMDPYDGIGNQIFYAPPAGPSYQGDNLDRWSNVARKQGEVIDIQNWLHENEDHLALPLVWSVGGLTINENKTWSDPFGTGFHVVSQVAETRANIILNLRCNAKLHRIKPYPYSQTCCTDYGVKPVFQVGVVTFGIIYLAACIICEVWDLCTTANKERPRWTLLNMQTGTFVLALLMCYYADRTQMMPKGRKLWQLKDFGVLCSLCVTIMLVTIRRSQSRLPEHLPVATDESSESLLPSDQPHISETKSRPFLSREQAQEWKGWMQFLILIYYWTGAEDRFLSILIRLCIAAYLFQLGYEHTLYFLEEDDFSFNYVATIFLRLNILSFALAYFMDTDYLFYHFSPLLSFWFLIIYATMAVGPKRSKANRDAQFVLAKICVSCVLVSAIFTKTAFTQWTFSILQTVFKIQWSDENWQDYATTDIFIVYIGMGVAVVSREMGMTVNLGLRIILALAGLFATFQYFTVALSQSTSTYIDWHPYISFVPVTTFIVLRNIASPIRNYHSKAMAWLGRCSLETYILQSHLLLAADKEGVLVVEGLFGDGTLLGDRWRTLLIITPIFLWISHETRSATAYITDLVMYQTPEAEKLGEPPIWLRKIPGSAYISLPKLRILGLLLVMWLINVLSPGHEIPLAPDGEHDVTIAPRPPWIVPY